MKTVIIMLLKPVLVAEQTDVLKLVMADEIYVALSLLTLPYIIKEPSPKTSFSCHPLVVVPILCSVIYFSESM
jgi:hypothetical protein